MVEFALDDDERGSNASSDNEQDEIMEDVADMDAEGDSEGSGSSDDESDDEPGEDARRPSLNTTNSSGDTPSQINGGPTSHPHPALTRTSASPKRESAGLESSRVRFEVRPEALTASSYDIVPTIAAPQSTSINAIAATPDMRFWFSGGSDCYIRKYDGAATVNGKTLLTVAQRHPFVDSVVKAGVLLNYWDNEEPVIRSADGGPDDHPLSPVYALAVQSQALWMLSGLGSGAINLYSVRHDEGKRIAHLIKHRSAVSVLSLAQDERSVLSGSWDKNIFDWDLNTGQAKRSFEGSGGQISAIEVRPASSLPVPEESGDLQPLTRENETFTNGNNSRVNGTSVMVNGYAPDDKADDPNGSPSNDSLFGGGSDTNSLFGETAGDGAPSGGNFGDEDDEFSRAMGVELDNPESLDVPNEDADATTAAVKKSPTPGPSQEEQAMDFKLESGLQSNGAIHPESAEDTLPMQSQPETQDAIATTDSTFLAASMDGSIRVWDRRVQNPVARISTRIGVPPWCMAACWSPDGNFIYAGRRNGTVEEFSLHKGLRNPERTIKFPAGSNAISAIKAMPNGRHLICASQDILRLYDLKHSIENKNSMVPFLIVPGPPRPGLISALHIDPTCKYMLSAAGHRGWEGNNTEVLIGYEIGVQQ